MNQKPRHVEIGALRRDRLLLEVGCSQCGRHSFLDPVQLPFADHEPVPTLWRKMRCSQCGARAAYTRGDPRQPGGMGGT